MTTSFDHEYNRLNPEQKQAVDTLEGPVFVTAGPGTGKTQILTLRIAQLLNKTPHLEPEQILALTFTNAAAHNMRERLSRMIGVQDAHRVYIATFHSFAEDMIKRFPEYFQRFQSASLISPVEQLTLIETLIDKATTQYFSVFKRRQGTIKAVSFAFGKIKQEGMTPDQLRRSIQERFDHEMDSDDIRYKRAYKEFKKGDIKPLELRKITERRDKNLELADMYETYQQALIEEQRYDYQDLILSLVQELESDSLLQTELQEQFHYILVDEHQDTNDGQNRILASLIDAPVWEGKPNLFVVGDPKQSIFRFAGASQKSFLGLFQSLNDVMHIGLKTNYRSQQGILDHAQELIDQSSHHTDDPQLQAFQEYEGEMHYREFQTDVNEVLWIAQDIQQRIAEGVTAESIAVLFRNNRDAELLKNILGRYGIEYQDSSKQNILKDSNIIKLFLLFQMVADPTNNENTAKVLFIDFLDFDLIGVQKILRAFRYQRNHNLSLFELLGQEKRLVELGLDVSEVQKYHDFTSLIKAQQSKAHNESFMQFFSDFIRDSGFLSALLSHPQSARMLPKLEALFHEIRKEALSRETFLFSDFMTYLSTLYEHDLAITMVNQQSKGVSLMTFHGSKGLEFDTVYILHALKKRKPAREIQLPFEDFSEGDIEDERRLMYVAITRAKKDCLISSYRMNPEGREQSRSLHIDEIAQLAHIDMEPWEQEHAHGIFDFFAESQQKLYSLLDKEYIQERFFTRPLSVSALNNFMESPILYFFRNLVLLPQAQSPFLEFGNLVHGTLESFFDQAREHRQVGDIDVLKQSFDQQLESRPVYRQYKDRAWGVIESYVQHYHGDFHIPLENEFRVPAVSFAGHDGVEIMLTGVMDKITREKDGSITVWDYKTGRAYSDMDARRKEKLQRQATFYKLLLQSAFDRKYNPSRIIFDFIEPNKKGEYERKEYHVESEDLEKLRGEIESLINAVTSGRLLEVHTFSDTADSELSQLLAIMKSAEDYTQTELF